VVGYPIPVRRSPPHPLQIGRKIHVVPDGQELDRQSDGGRCFLRATQYIRGSPRDAVKELVVYVSQSNQVIPAVLGGSEDDRFLRARQSLQRIHDVRRGQRRKVGAHEHDASETAGEQIAQPVPHPLAERFAALDDEHRVEWRHALNLGFALEWSIEHGFPGSDRSNSRKGIP
jgi:hypothetical protein